MLKSEQLSGLIKEVTGTLRKLQEWQAETGPLDVAAIVPGSWLTMILAQAQDLQIGYRLDRPLCCMSESCFPQGLLQPDETVRSVTPRLSGTIHIYREGQKLELTILASLCLTKPFH